MDCHTPCPQVAHTEHATNDIPAHAIKDKDFPDWVAILAQNGRCMGGQALRRGVMKGVFRGRGFMVQVEDLLNRDCDEMSIFISHEV